MVPAPGVEPGTLITSQLLYQLSYTGEEGDVIASRRQE